MQNKNTAFTLVELIVVITILAILGTIAFISLQGYSSESRDSKRISDLGQIRTGLSIEQAREGNVPMPDNEVIISNGGTTYTHQGYAGTGVLNSLRVSEAKDPTDDEYYTYTTNSNQTRFQLVAMLENGETAYNNLLSKTYADYENRIAYTIGDSLGTLLEGTTKIPVHQLVSATDIDLENNTTDYIPVFTREDNSTTSSGSELVTRIEESQKNINGSNNESSTSEYVGGTTYGSGETFSYDGLNWYVSGNDNVAYTKSSGTNDIPNNLTDGDNILVFDNGTGSLVKGTTAFVIRTVNEGATEPYIYGTSYGSGHLWNEGSSYSSGAIAYENDKTMLGDFFQWGRNDQVSLLDTTTDLYDEGGYMTGGVDLSGSGFITPTSSPYSWMTELKHDETINVTWTDNTNSSTCPSNYHIPSTSTTTGEGEWRIMTELVTGITVADGSAWPTSEIEKLQKYLLMPMSGSRSYNSGNYNNIGNNAYYWASSPNGAQAYSFVLKSGLSGPNPSQSGLSSFRAYGFSVRCFKN